MYDNLYQDIHSSFTKFTIDTINEIAIEGQETPEFIIWDAHANINELEDKDLIGISAVTLTDNEGIMEASCSFGVSTYGDKNLFRQTHYISKLFGKTRLGNNLDLYNFQTASKRGWMQAATPTIVSPVEKSENRPFQFVQGIFMIDLFGASS